MASNETGKEVSGERGRRRVEIGVVTSSRMDKTIVVSVDRAAMHPLYKKVVRVRRKFLAHDESNECGAGDRVKIAECRPLSKRKRWRVVEVVDKAPAA